MKTPPKWPAIVVELLLYSGLLALYFIFVLHYLGDWFKEIYDKNRNVYAAVALLIMIGQAVGLEIICSFLIWAVKSKEKAKGK